MYLAMASRLGASKQPARLSASASRRGGGDVALILSDHIPYRNMRQDLVLGSVICNFGFGMTALAGMQKDITNLFLNLLLGPVRVQGTEAGGLEFARGPVDLRSHLELLLRCHAPQDLNLN